MKNKNLPKIIALAVCAVVVIAVLATSFTVVKAGHTGVVVTLGFNETVAAEGTEAKIEEVKNALIAGEVEVFDTDNFTVGGKKLDNYKADVDSDEKFEKDTEVIEDGVFYESKHRSAPYFDVEIDGITLLDEKY